MTDIGVSRFPFYDSLLATGTGKSTWTQEELREMSIAAAKLPRDLADILFALIVHHDAMCPGPNKKRGLIPYGGGTFSGKKGILYSNMSTLPPTLLQVISAYLDYVTCK